MKLQSNIENKTEWEVGFAMIVNSFDFFLSVLKKKFILYRMSWLYWNSYNKIKKNEFYNFVYIQFYKLPIL